MSSTDTRIGIQDKLKILSEELWEGRCSNRCIEEWLSNFDGRHSADRETERLHAMHLLSAFSYIGFAELGVLLVSMYRDFFRYPIIQNIRRDLEGTRDAEAVNRAFVDELNATRFLGMGNPAESGTHLLYHFRQENRIPLRLFVQHGDLFTGGVTDDATRLAEGIERVVFIDDLCGSGDQAVRYSRGIVRDLKAVAAREGTSIECHFLVLFATQRGIANVRQESAFDDIRAVNELDETHMTYGPLSRVFRNAPDGISEAQSRQIAERYGRELVERWPLGYGDSQLLLGFHHNVPNNTLPIVWWSNGEHGWKPAFPRQRKR